MLIHLQRLIVKKIYPYKLKYKKKLFILAVQRHIKYAFYVSFYCTYQEKNVILHIRI